MYKLNNTINNSYKLLFAVACLLVINGCVSIKAEDCINADWRAAGFQDGAKGEKASRVSFYRQACNKFGIAVDTTTYSLGHTDGIHEYCQPRNAYKVGLKGREHQSVCPAELEQGFIEAYEYGKNIYTLKKELKSTKRETTRNKKKLKRLTKSLDKKQGELDKAVTAQSPHQDLISETTQLVEEKNTLEEKVNQLENTISTLDSQIKNLMQKKWE